jgi:pimeloyl-ACP methyl ester carboxylesterase
MPSVVALVGLVVALIVPPRCAPESAGRRPSDPSMPPGAGRGADGAERGPIRIELLDASASNPTYVMRGGPHGPGRIVFLHGVCGHGQGYAQSFQWSAAKIGTLIAPQGDIPCGDGPFAKWSPNVDALDARVVATYRALGEVGLIDDIAVVGYSQGASRAEALARRFPERYTRLVLIGAPEIPNPRGLSGVRAAVMMAGDYDNQPVMKDGATKFRNAGIRAIFLPIPDARHGEMGPEPERTMGRALEWLWEG